MDEKHIVEFTKTGYALQHPLACRPNLLDCKYDFYLREFKDEPDKEPGRYYMLMIEHEGFEGYYMVGYSPVA